MDRSWMYNRFSTDSSGISEDFLIGVRKFVKFAVSKSDGDEIRCPCRDCANLKCQIPDVITTHLYKRGFVANYLKWINHGEPYIISSTSDDATASRPVRTLPLRTDHTFFNQPRPSNVAETSNVFYHNSSPVNDESEIGTSPSYVPSSDNLGSESFGANDDIGLSEDFWDNLEAADEPLWNGCEESVLSSVCGLLKIKSEFNMSEKCYNKICQWASTCMPQDHKLPSDIYHSRKMVRDLGMPIEKYDMCPQGCMLFWKEDISLQSCKFCNHARYKSNKGRKPVPHKILRYLPLAPRLQKLYAFIATAKHMRWHHTHQIEEGIMCHPSDSESWRHFDRTFPDFASESRNVRLSLSTDGFAPFGQSGKVYSCWPVIVTPLNLPPEMCQKTPYTFLSMVIPGPKNPKKLIDVCLQPLIDELKLLWTQGVPTRDVSSNNEIFQMRAALLWTINDFPAYGMMSGWSTAGKMACPVCKETTKSIYLRYCRKCSWFDDHRRFLEPNHPYRRNKKAFTKNRKETSSPPKRLTGEEIWSRVRDLPTVIDDPGLGEIEGFKKTHKWVKQSIYWQLPYWPTLLLPHNLDVMHIEKNVFDNIFFTLMGDKGRSKDMLNARKDMKLICDRPTLEVDEDHTGPIPKALYTITKEERQQVCDWVKSVKFPDGYASNIGRCVQVDDCRLIGMKSHDCHIFMQRLLPIAFKEVLSAFVWGPITELSLFFQALCSPTLSVAQMEELDNAIVLILCKLEKIFPPSFFDSMEHLLIHLPYEAKIGGPNQYRWMYKTERFLHSLKQKIGNKAHVEASICSSYILEEISTLAEHHFKYQVSSKRRKCQQTDDADSTDNSDKPFSIFNYPGRGIVNLKPRWLTEDEDEKHAIERFILMNCDEVGFYANLFSQQIGGADDRSFETDFAPWFSSYVLDPLNKVTDKLITSLSRGPLAKAKTFSGYVINGYTFHTMQRAENKSTMNSGVWVKGKSADGKEVDYYGHIEEILQIEYPGIPKKKVVLFKCRWFNPIRGMRVNKKYGLVEVNPKQLYRAKDPFILAQQAKQVYYVSYPGAKGPRIDWLAACKTNARSTIEQRWTEVEEVYQPAERVASPILDDDVIPENLRDPSGENVTVDHVLENVEARPESDSISDNEDLEEEEDDENEERIIDDDEDSEDDF